MAGKASESGTDLARVAEPVWKSGEGAPPHRRPMPASCCSDEKRWSHAKKKKSEKKKEKEKKKKPTTPAGGPRLCDYGVEGLSG